MFESTGGKAVQQQHRFHNTSAVPPSWFLQPKIQILTVMFVRVNVGKVIFLELSQSF